MGALLFVASLVAIATHRLKLPYSVGLVVAGVAIAMLPVAVPLTLTPELIFFVLLPPLVFEAAIQIPWKPFRRELPLLIALVTFGVLLAAAVVTVGMHWLSGWSWLGAAFFGVLIAATDPVAVIAAFKTMHVERRLHLLVESESLLNDGVAAVGFAILMMFATGAGAGAGEVGLHLVTNISGAILSGAAGFIGSHIVCVLLNKGYRVKACVRNVDDPVRCDFLKAMPAYKTGRLTLHNGDVDVEGIFDDILPGCHGFCHVSHVSDYGNEDYVQGVAAEFSNALTVGF